MARPTTSPGSWLPMAFRGSTRARWRAGPVWPAGMRRFAITPEAVADGRVTFDAPQSRHLARALRLRPGDTIIASDGSGRDYTVRLEVIGARVTGIVLGEAAGAAESP